MPCPHIGVRIESMLTVKQLYDIQEIDLKYASLEKSLAEVRAELADDSALPTARERVDGIESRLKDIVSTRHVVEGSITDLQERVKGIESKLYGGAVTSPRELAAADEERNFTLGQQRNEEDKLLGGRHHERLAAYASSLRLRRVDRRKSGDE